MKKMLDSFILRLTLTPLLRRGSYQVKPKVEAELFGVPGVRAATSSLFITGRVPRSRIKLSRHYFRFRLAGCNQEFFQLLAQFTGLRTILLAPSQVHQLVWIGALIIELVLM